MPARTAPPSRRLAALRKRIDAADRALVRALAARRRVVADLAAHKREHGLPQRDAARERQLLADRRALARALGVPVALIDAVFRAVLAASHAQLARAMRPRATARARGRGTAG